MPSKLSGVRRSGTACGGPPSQWEGLSVRPVLVLAEAMDALQGAIQPRVTSPAAFELGFSCNAIPEVDACERQVRQILRP